MTLEQLATQGRRTETLTMAATIGESISRARKSSLRNYFIDCERVKHRNEVVEYKNGMSYIDDSGARSISATYFTLSETSAPTVWITVGGKGDYEELIPVVRQCVVSVICVGECTDSVVRTFSGVVRGSVKTAADMKEAVTLAERIAVPGSNILFSPANSSQDKNIARLASDFVKIAKK